MDSIYSDGTYLDSNPQWHSEDSEHKARWIAGILSGLSEPIQTIAEVGCGAGEIIVELKKLFPRADFWGFDVSPHAISICAPKASQGVTFHHGEIGDLDRTYDILLAIDVLEHVEDYMGFLRSLKAHAKYKVFHVPLDLSVQGLLRGKSIMYARHTVGHLHYFDQQTALATLQDCGYEIISWHYTRGSEELPNMKVRAKIMNIPRKLLRMVSEDLSVRLLGGASLLVITR